MALTVQKSKEKKGGFRNLFSRPQKKEKVNKAERNDHAGRQNTPQTSPENGIPDGANYMGKRHSDGMTTKSVDDYYNNSTNQFHSMPRTSIQHQNQTGSPNSSGNLDNSVSPMNHSNVGLLSPSYSQDFRRSGRFTKKQKPVGNFWRSGSMRGLKKYLVGISNSRENLSRIGDDGIIRPASTEPNYDSFRNDTGDSISFHGYNTNSVDSGRGTPDNNSREPSLHTLIGTRSTNSLNIDILPPPPYQNHKKKKTVYPECAPATSGISNHGNTCYMNAVVQCLCNTDPLAEFMVADKFYEHLAMSSRQVANAKRYGSDGEITKAFAKFLYVLWTNEYTPDISKRWNRLVGIYGRQFDNNQQQDAQELLTWLLDKVHEDLNQANSSRKYRTVKKMNSQVGEENMAEEAMTNHRKHHDSYISNLFEAQFRSAIECPTCRRVSLNFDPYMCVPLPVPQNTTKPLFVVVVQQGSPPNRQICYGLNADATASMLEIKKCLADVVGLNYNQMILSWFTPEGWGSCLSDKEEVSSLPCGARINAIDTPSLNEDDNEELIVLVTNAVQQQKSCCRYGGAFALKVHRQLSYGDLCRSLLHTVRPQLKPIQIQDIPLDAFSIEQCDEYSGSLTLDSNVPMPLYTEYVDRSLRICGSKIRPVHLKLCIVWSCDSASKYLRSDVERVLEHTSSHDLTNEMNTPNKADLYSCLKEYTKPEDLESWYCAKCRRHQQNAHKTLSFWSLPDILILHLNRFKTFPDGSQVKLDPVVKFPIKGLDLSKYVYQGAGTPYNMRKENNKINGGLYVETNEEHMYDLYAVCNHLGDSMNSGHYNALCRNPVDGQWRKFDDHDVSIVTDSNSLISKSSYLLFYERRGSHSVGSCASGESGFFDHWYSRTFSSNSGVSNPMYYNIKDLHNEPAPEYGRLLGGKSGLHSSEDIAPNPPPRSISIETLSQSNKPPLAPPNRKAPMPAPRNLSKSRGAKDTVSLTSQNFEDAMFLERTYSTRIKTNSQVETDF